MEKVEKMKTGNGSIHARLSSLKIPVCQFRFESLSILPAPARFQFPISDFRFQDLGFHRPFRFCQGRGETAQSCR